MRKIANIMLAVMLALMLGLAFVTAYNLGVLHALEDGWSFIVEYPEEGADDFIMYTELDGEIYEKEVSIC